MSELSDSEKISILVDTYEQLDRNHHHHNKIIHQTFYLSVIFVGAIVSVIFSRGGIDNLTAIISAVASIIVLLLGISTHMYLSGRAEIKSRKEKIIRELDYYDIGIEEIDGVDDLFFYRHEIYIEDSKRYFQEGYYYVLSLVFFVISIYVVL